MEKITIKNTAIIINNYHMGDCEKLEQCFQVWDPITHSHKPFLMYYDAERERLYLPSGIDLWFIQKHLGVKEYERIMHHDYQDTGEILMKYPPRNDRQWEALFFLLGQKQYERNRYMNVLSLNLSTGIGKTYLSIATICARRMNSMIIAGTQTLLGQWKSEFLRYTNLKDSDIVSIEDSNMITMILNGNSRKIQQAKIFLCNHKTINSFCKRYGWDKLDILFRKLRIGLKVIDEFHYNVENGWMINFFTNVKYTYLVTATPGRSAFQEDRIYKLATKNIPYIDLFDEDEDPHTDYVAIKYNTHPSPQVISACRNKYGLDRMKYVNWVTQNPEFYKMLTVLMNTVLKIILEDHHKVLMYIGTNDGILRVYHWISNHYPALIGEIGIFSSLVSKEEKLEEKKKSLLLSTLKSAGLGEHIEGLQLTIVLAEPFKSEIQARQSIGRTRDPNTMYIELVDVGFIQIRRFYNYKIHVFNKYASSISDDTISSYELNKRYYNAVEKQAQRLYSPIEFFDKRFKYPDDVDNRMETFREILKEISNI